VGVSRPAMMRSNVVLPHPDGPSSTKNSPSCTLREMPSTAVTGPKRLVILLAATEATATSMATRRTEPPAVTGPGRSRPCQLNCAGGGLQLTPLPAADGLTADQARFAHLS